MASFPTSIRSARNPRLKQLSRLQTRRARKASGRTLVYGRREITRAAEAAIPMHELWVAEEAWNHFDASWVKQLCESGTHVFTVPESLLQPLTYGDRQDGCVAVVSMPETKLHELVLPENPCVAIVERVEKPGNLGAIFRSADGAGIAAIVLVDPVTDVSNPNVIRASMGTVFTVPHCTITREEVAAWVRQLGLQLVATRVDATDLYYEVDLTRPTAVVLGSEAAGLDDQWRSLGERSVRLPMFGIADSLNVSATAAVIFYEVLRQRSVKERQESRGS